MWNPNHGMSLHPAAPTLALGIPLCHVTPCHATPRHAALLSITTPHSTTLPRLFTNLNNDINKSRPQTFLHFHPYAATRGTGHSISFTHDDSGIHHYSLPSSSRSLPPSRSETKIVCYELAGVTQAQTTRDGIASCCPPLSLPTTWTFLPGETAAGTFFRRVLLLFRVAFINKIPTGSFCLSLPATTLTAE
jgi:hypothetical protein